ncbi:hypothetical protein [Alloactinosynnema sp. L-07]|nr:hypothetical protein [Alloactinosynnema sp. L-07]CRK59475.1 hypothetical protein [Alloactinosynnema sp. L-07]
MVDGIHGAAPARAEGQGKAAGQLHPLLGAELKRIYEQHGP